MTAFTLSINAAKAEELSAHLTALAKYFATETKPANMAEIGATLRLTFYDMMQLFDEYEQLVKKPIKDVLMEEANETNLRDVPIDLWWKIFQRVLHAVQDVEVAQQLFSRDADLGEDFFEVLAR